MKRKNFKFFIFLCLIFFLFSFSLVLAQEERKLEVEYPEIGGIKPETVATGLPNYVKYIFNFSVIGFGLVVLGVLIWGGVRYLTSAGQPAKLKDASDQILAAFLGVVILLSSYLILTTINPQLAIFNIPFLSKVVAPERKPLEFGEDELTLTSLEIPLGQMVTNGIWQDDRISAATSTLEAFEKFLTEEITVGDKTFNRISDLSKYLKTLADDCRCDALTALCDKPENLGGKVGCTGDPCKDRRDEITKILGILAFDENSKTKKLSDPVNVTGYNVTGYKEKIAQQLEFFSGEAEKYLNASDKLQECMERGVVLTRNEYLAQVEFYEEQGWKTKVITSPGYQPLSTAEGLPVTGGIPVRITSYFPGEGGIEGGFNDRRGHRLHTLKDYEDGDTTQVGIAVAKQLYDNGTFYYGDIVRIPELEAKYGNKIRFVVVDTGSALTGAYPREIIADVAFRRKGQAAPSRGVDGPATITKAAGGSAGDSLTFYCSVGGTMFDLKQKPVEIPLELTPKEIPPELTQTEQLSCPAEIPVGEILDEVALSADSATLDLDELIINIDLLVRQIRNMTNLISECNEQNCEADCGYLPNPCYGCCSPWDCGACVPLCLFPGLQTFGVCKSNKPDAPYHGSPCPRDKIEETLEKIEIHEDEILKLLKEEKTNFASTPYILETPKGSANLLAAVRAASSICFSEKTDEPTWAMLNCEMALGNIGPDGRTITGCHPQNFFCCASKEVVAQRLSSLPVLEKPWPSTYIDSGKSLSPGKYGFNDVPYFSQGKPAIWAGDKCRLPRGVTLARKGCKITSTAMVLKYYDVDTDPRQLNKWMRSIGLLASSCSMSEPFASIKGKFGISGRNIGKKKVIESLKAKRPIVIGYSRSKGRKIVSLVSGSKGQHWIVFTGIDKTHIHINDPNYKRGIRTISIDVFLESDRFKRGEFFYPL